MVRSLVFNRTYNMDEDISFIRRVVNMWGSACIRMSPYRLVIYCTLVSWRICPLRIVTACFFSSVSSALYACPFCSFFFFPSRSSTEVYVFSHARYQFLTLSMITGMKCSHIDATMVHVQNVSCLARPRCHVATFVKRGMCYFWSALITWGVAFAWCS